MKRFCKLLLLFLFFVSASPHLTLHAVRPRVAYAAVSAVAFVSGINIGLSAKKRTAAISHAAAQHATSADVEQLKRERVLYTGGAALLGAGITAAVAIPLTRRLPAARILRARNLVAQVQKHELTTIKGDFLSGVRTWGAGQNNTEKCALDILKTHQELLQRAQQEVKSARADYQYNILAHVPEDIAAAVLKADITCAQIDLERSIAALSPEKAVGVEAGGRIS